MTWLHRLIISSLLGACLTGCNQSRSHNNGGSTTIPTSSAWTSVGHINSNKISQDGLGFFYEESSANVHLVGGIIDYPGGPNSTDRAARFSIQGNAPFQPVETSLFPTSLAYPSIFRTSSNLLSIGGVGNIMAPSWGGSQNIFRYTTGGWTAVYTDGGIFQGTHFVHNGALLRFIPRNLGSRWLNQRGMLERFNETTLNWELITDQGLNDVPTTTYLHIGNKLLAFGGFYNDSNDAPQNTSDVVSVDLSNLPQVTVSTLTNTPGEVLLYGKAPIIYVDETNGKAYTWANSRGYPVAGIYEYDVSSNTITRRADLDPPVNVWSSFSVSNQGRPDTNGDSWIYLESEFNSSTSSGSTMVYDDRSEIFRFRPR